MTLPAAQTRQPLTAERDALSANNEQRLTLVTPEFQEQLGIAWDELNSWVSFRVRTQLVQAIYQGNSLNVNLSEVRDRIVIPEYTRQQRIAIDEARDVHERLLPGLNLRSMIAQNDISEAQSRGDISTLTRRSDDLVSLTNDIERAKLKKRIKETTASSINSLLTDENQDGLNIQVDIVTRKAKKEALREVIQVLANQMTMIQDSARDVGIDNEAAHVLNVNERKIKALEAELDALEAVEEYTAGAEQYVQQPESLDEKAPGKEMMRPRALIGSLAGVAMNLRVAFFK